MTAREYEVSESGHIYWNVRDRAGRFASRAILEARRRAAIARQLLAERRAAYRAYLDARHDAAEAATRGHLLRDWTRGSIARLFAPGASMRNASEELADWFAVNGQTLSYREFAAQF
jgi:hypothetical protein